MLVIKNGYTDVCDGCWRRNVLVTVSAISVTNILYFLTLVLGTNVQKCHQDLNSVANILKLSPTVSYQHHNVTHITVAGTNY